MPGCENRPGPPLWGRGLVGDPVGVEKRSGDGDEGDSGRRNGEFRVGDDGYPNGEPLYGDVVDLFVLLAVVTLDDFAALDPIPLCHADLTAAVGPRTCASKR